MLELILDTNPETRNGIPELRRSKWCLQSNVNPEPGIIVGTNLIPINEETLSLTAEHGIIPEYCRKCLDGNKHNGSTTTYYLLLKKHGCPEENVITSHTPAPLMPRPLMSRKGKSKHPPVPHVSIDDPRNRRLSTPSYMPGSTGGSSSREVNLN